MKLRYFARCVEWPQEDVAALSAMIASERQVTRRTFLKHVDPADCREIERGLGYHHHHTRGLTMARDWHVGYYRGQLHGKTVYFFRWSAIEYVFAAAA